MSPASCLLAWFSLTTCLQDAVRYLLGPGRDLVKILLNSAWTMKTTFMILVSHSCKNQLLIYTRGFLAKNLPNLLHLHQASLVPRSPLPVLIAYSMQKWRVKLWNWRCRRPGNEVCNLATDIDCQAFSPYHNVWPHSPASQYKSCCLESTGIEELWKNTPICCLGNGKYQ